MARQKWQEWNENEDNIAVLRAWARAGLTDEDIAETVAVAEEAFEAVRKRHPL